MGIVSTRTSRKAAVKAAARRILTVLTLGVLIVGAIHAYDRITTSERFAIAEVELSGMSRVASDDVERLLADLEGHNVFLAPLDQYEARLEDHERIHQVELKRVLPDRIRCEVVEREPVALVYTDRFYEIDTYGMVMAGDEFTPHLDLPVISGLSGDEIEAGVVCDLDAARGALDVLGVCREVGGDFACRISEIQVGPHGITVRSLEDDCVLVLGTEDYATRLRKYFLLKGTLAEERYASRWIDLRFDDQVVMRAQM